MTVNMFFRLIRNRKINYQLIMDENPIECSRRIPTPYWFNEIYSINMIQETFIIHITEKILKDEYDPNGLKVKYSELVKVLNDNVYIYSPTKYIKNQDLYIQALFIEKSGCLEIY